MHSFAFKSPVKQEQRRRHRFWLSRPGQACRRRKPASAGLALLKTNAPRKRERFTATDVAANFKQVFGGIEVKTYYAKPLEVERNWVLIDAEDQILGRVAVEAAKILRGKNKPQYTPHVDTGDFVVIINAEKIRVTGNKATDKRYYRHSGYPGGLKSESFNEAIAKHPERVLEHAVKGMLPKNTLGRAMGKKLKVYAGPEHPHAAQQPREFKMEG